MNKYTAYAIATASMVRTWKGHSNPIVREVSPDHVRYRFHYPGDPVPFFSIHVTREEGVLREFTRIDSEPKLTRSGYPVVLHDDETWLVWNGDSWELEPALLDADLDTFDLFLTCGQVGVLWL